MKRRHIFSGMILIFLTGVFLFDSFRSDLLLVLPFVFLIGLIVPRIKPEILFLWSFSFFWGMLRVFLAISVPQSDEAAFYARAEEHAPEVTLTGTVQNFPDEREKKTSVYVQSRTLTFLEKELNIFGKVLVNLPAGAEVSYGDILEVRGKLTIPPEWEDFSYRRYLEKEGVHAYFPRAQFQKIGRSGTALFRTLFALRQKTEATLRQRIPEPASSFAVGILLGGQRGFSEDLIATFQRTGLSHLLALSGFNITILIFFVFWVFRFLPKSWKLGLTMVFIAAFVLMTGASASVVRAAVMGILALLVLHFGQETDPLYILLWSVFLIVLANPFLLRSDVSFQLSVAGVLGLILLTPLWQKAFSRLPNYFGISEGLQATLAAQIMTLPLIVFYFGRLSLIAPFANVPIAPLIPIAMFLSFLTLFPGIGLLAGFGAYGLLTFALALTALLAKIPFADIPLTLSVSGMIFWYLLWFCILCYFFQRRRKEMRKI